MDRRSSTPLSSTQWEALQNAFGERLQRDVALARYTAARVGGPADAFLIVESVDDLASTAAKLWDLKLPFFILGSGSNLLVSDAGVRGVVVLNRAREIKINASPPSVWAGSGANFGLVARKVSSQGFGGLEWAIGIPGTVGGAVFGNAGAHGGDVAGSLLMAEILHRDRHREHWPVEKMDYAYRSSIFKREATEALILAASFRLEQGNTQEIKRLVDDYAARRRRTQPPGASMGSVFKNPPSDYAGRLIEAAGLKGTRIGGAEISPIHANFFINHGETKAKDIFGLIEFARNTVSEKFGVELELEIELLGDW